MTPPLSASRGGFARLTPDQARDVFAYNRAVLGRFVRRARELPVRTAHRRRGIGHESIFDTLVHILNVHEVWLGHILQGRSSDAELEALFADRTRHPKDWRGFARYERRVWTIVETYLGRVRPNDLARSVHVFWMPGSYSGSDGLWQSTLEQAHHLGEIIGALWQEDREPPEMTWIRVTAPMRTRRAGRRTAGG